MMRQAVLLKFPEARCSQHCLRHLLSPHRA
jgi:hypothetical protein